MNIPENVKNIIFVSDGGMGRAIASTAVIKAVKAKYPEKKIIVVSGYQDIFINNPNVFKVFNFGNPLYFYDDYVTPESFLMHVEPYRDHNYLHGEKHLIEAWGDMLGVDTKGSVPEMFFGKKELEGAQYFVEKITGNGKKKFIMLQWIGGISPQDKTKHGLLDAQGRMHKRSLSQGVAQKLVNKLVTRGYAVGVVQTPNYPDLEGDGVEKISFPIRQTVALLKHAESFIGIDSFLQHAAVAMGKSGLVLWGGTNPKRLGYSQHTNLTREKCPTPMCHRPNSYIFDSNPSGQLWNCPHDEICCDYDADEIVEAYEKLKK